MNRSLTTDQLATLPSKLRDLAEFGIHIDNPRNHCYRCGAELDPKWSHGISIDSRCEACYKQDCAKANGIAVVIAPIYGRDTVYVLPPREDWRYPHAVYDAVVKIDGRLYVAEYSYQSNTLIDAETGFVARYDAIHISSSAVQCWWYEQQREAAEAIQAFLDALDRAELPTFSLLAADDPRRGAATVFLDEHPTAAYLSQVFGLVESHGLKLAEIGPIGPLRRKNPMWIDVRA